ncbi:MAG TPA: RNA methyltransferase [Eoetvoesiella sp.]
MKHISSRDNTQYKWLSRLVGGKRDGHVVLEGIHLCQEWLKHKGAPQLALFDSERLQHSSELAALSATLSSDLCVSCEPALMQRLSQVEHGQGVYFVASLPMPSTPSCITHNCLWLDRVQDPGNVGTLLRTAAAAGITHAYLSRGTASAWSQKVLRSAQGAHFVMSIYEQLDFLAEREKLAIPLIATALEDAQSLYDMALPRDCAWLVGNEGQGVDSGLLALADARVFIPQVQSVESLNVAVAAAICLFEQRRQLGC